MKENLKTIKNSTAGLKKLQKLSIPFETVYDISELIVEIEDKLKVYNKSALAIETKYLPVDGNGEPVFINPDKKVFIPTDTEAFLEDSKKLDEKEVEIKSKNITIFITEQLKKQEFTAEDMISLKWIITFKKLPVKKIKK